MNSLAVILTNAQIEVAGRLYRRLPQWQASEAALAALADKFPGFSDDAVLLKAVAINGLYGTKVLALPRMAVHAKRVIEKNDLRKAGLEFVEEIARLPASEEQRANRRYHSFAAKFAHFFVDPERFPVMDNYAVGTVRFHLGSREYRQNLERPYVAFVENLQRLKDLAGLSVTNRELDHYLWIAGEYRAFRKNPKAKISGEVKRLFTAPSESVSADLASLMPSNLSCALKGEL
jgi:hypothetical protein